VLRKHKNNVYSKSFPLASAADVAAAVIVQSLSRSLTYDGAQLIAQVQAAKLPSVAARLIELSGLSSCVCVHQLCTQVASRQVDGDEQCSVHTFMEPSTVAGVVVLPSPAQLLCSCVWCRLQGGRERRSARFGHGTIIGLGDCRVIKLQLRCRSCHFCWWRWWWWVLLAAPWPRHRKPSCRSSSMTSGSTTLRS
jgi:hypothetical protein